jgi:hypothetical protein
MTQVVKSLGSDLDFDFTQQGCYASVLANLARALLTNTCSIHCNKKSS